VSTAAKSSCVEFAISDPRAARTMTQTGVASAAIATDVDHKLCPSCRARHPEHFKVCPQDGTALVKADDLVGTTLSGTYTIVRILGEGGMGRVYEAQHTRIAGKRYALKTLHQKYARQPDLLTRFQREAEAAASIQSPNVVGVHDVDRTSDGRPFIVAEYLEGTELGDHLLKVRKIPVGLAVRIARQVCKALTAAHAKGVVHRDLKPENVFLTGDLANPIAKVIDFGISRSDDQPGPALTKTGMIIGTPSFMPPEQAQGERVDHRADIYAVGAILYCALTGRRPFDRDDPVATLVAVLAGDPPRPRSVDPSIPEKLEMVIQRAMARSPGDRYQTMLDLDVALAQCDPAGAHELARAPRAQGEPRAATVVIGGFATAAGSWRLLGRLAGEIRVARAVIVGVSVLGAVWFGGGMVTMIGVLVLLRWGGGAPTLTGSESARLILGVTCALLVPALVGAWYVRRGAWNSIAEAFDLSQKLADPVLVSVGLYGCASMAVVFLETLILRRAIGVASPVWDVMLFLISLGAATGTVVLQRLEKRS
jgi:tRNA A-37 threonylcarbamoyl transferase component Bud32